MENDFKFFRNAECHYFPCHTVEDNETFNCKFCYCPLYFFNDCGGNPTMAGKVKDCSHCLKPHLPGAHEYVNLRLKKYFEDLYAETQETSST